MKTCVIALMVLSTAVGAVKLQAQVNLLQNGSFDNHSISPYSGWTLNGALFALSAPTNEQQYADATPGAVALGWTTTLYQDIPTVVGQQYTFSFYMADWGPNGVPTNVVSLAPSFGNISLGTVSFSGAGHTYLSMGWEQFSYSVTADSTTTRVAFYNPGVSPSDTRWAAIDDVWVTPVPEPSVAALMLFGVALWRKSLRKDEG